MTNSWRLSRLAGAMLVAFLMAGALLAAAGPARAASPAPATAESPAAVATLKGTSTGTVSAALAADCLRQGGFLECTVYQPIRVWAHCSNGQQVSSGVIQPGRWLIPNFCPQGTWVIGWTWELA